MNLSRLIVLPLETRNLSTHLHIYPSTFLPTCLLAYILTYLSVRLHTYIYTCQLVYIPVYLLVHSHLPTYLPVCPSTYIPTYLLLAYGSLDGRIRLLGVYRVLTPFLMGKKP